MIAQRPLPRSKFASVAERVFFARYTGDVREIKFGSGDVVAAADEFGYAVEDQLGEFYVAYGFQQPLPRSIRVTAPPDFEWRLLNEAPDRYRFALRTQFRVVPDNMLAEYRVNDVTAGKRKPCGMMSKAELFDVIHANRLVENFTGLRCTSREMDFRADVPLGYGTPMAMPVIIDDLVFGESQRRTRYVMPIYFVSEVDPLDTQQVGLAVKFSRTSYSDYVCLPLVVQGIGEDVIVLLSLEPACDGLRKGPERRTRLIAEALDEAKSRPGPRPIP